MERNRRANSRRTVNVTEKHIVLDSNGYPKELRLYEDKILVTRLELVKDSSNRFVGMRELDVEDVIPFSWLDSLKRWRQRNKKPLLTLTTVDFIGLINWIDTINTIKTINTIETIDTIDTIDRINNIADLVGIQLQILKNPDFLDGLNYWVAAPGSVSNGVLTLPEDNDLVLQETSSTYGDYVRIEIKAKKSGSGSASILFGSEFDDLTNETTSEALTDDYAIYSLNLTTHKLLANVILYADITGDADVLVDSIKAILNVQPVSQVGTWTVTATQGTPSNLKTEVSQGTAASLKCEPTQTTRTNLLAKGEREDLLIVNAAGTLAASGTVSLVSGVSGQKIKVFSVSYVKDTETTISMNFTTENKYFAISLKNNTFAQTFTHPQISSAGNGLELKNHDATATAYRISVQYKQEA